MHCGQKCKLVQLLWKTVWRLLKKLKIELPYDPAILLLGIYLKKTKSLTWKDICTPMFTAALFTIAKIQKQPKSPPRENGKRRCDLYVQCLYTISTNSAIKKNEILPFSTTWKDIKGIMLSEIRRRNTISLWFHLYVESKKQNRSSLTDTENKLVVARGERGWRVGFRQNQWRGLRGTDFQL